jgi:hypothetical protein
MRQNTDFTFLVCCVFAFMAVTSFFFWLKAQQIAWKYKSQFPDTSSVLPPYEKKLLRKYRKKIFLFIVIGTVLLFTLYFLHGIDILFPSVKK